MNETSEHTNKPTGGFKERLESFKPTHYINTLTRLFNPSELLGGLIPDILDNIPSKNPPTEIQHQGDNRKLIDSLINPQVKQNILQTLADPTWQIGESRGIVPVVGDKKTNSAHPHFFEIIKTDLGAELIFVDPEDQVGRHNKFRPAIVNLLAARIGYNPEDDQLAVLRFRSENFRVTGANALNIPNQYIVAQDLLNSEYKGKPPLLHNNESEILFRLFVKPDESLIQTRYSTAQQSDSFLRTGTSWNPVLLGKRTSIRALIERFSKVSENFTSNPDSARSFLVLKEKANKIRSTVYPQAS